VAEASPDWMRAWAEELVSRVRDGGVSLPGDGGLLTSMVREVLRAGRADGDMADRLGPLTFFGCRLGGSGRALCPLSS
jgi:hypothetical protein